MPGGGLRRGEPPADGAGREIGEEVDDDLVDWRQAGVVESTTLHKRDRTFYLHADVGDAELRLDRPEFSEVMWWGQEEPPPGSSPDLVNAARRGLLARR